MILLAGTRPFFGDRSRSRFMEATGVVSSPGGFESEPVRTQTVPTRPDYRIKPREFFRSPGSPQAALVYGNPQGAA